jgi:hypothetical protein
MERRRAVHWGQDEPGREVDAMKSTAGNIVLGLSACGYPLTQFAVRRCGMRGAAAAEAVYAGLAIRDASMVASGVPGRLRAIPAALLRLELAAAIAASLAGLPPLPGVRPANQTSSARAGAADAVRRAATATMFAVGGCPKNAVQALAGTCPIVGSYGEKDRTPMGHSAAPRLEQALTALGVDHDVKVYPGAGHGFINNPDPADATPLLIFLAKISGTRYHEPSAQDTRRRIAAFFGKHLKN